MESYQAKGVGNLVPINEPIMKLGADLGWNSQGFFHWHYLMLYTLIWVLTTHEIRVKKASRHTGTNIEERAKVRVQLHRMYVLLLNINYKNNNDTIQPVVPQVWQQYWAGILAKNSLMHVKVLTFAIWRVRLLH